MSSKKKGGHEQGTCERNVGTVLRGRVRGPTELQPSNSRFRQEPAGYGPVH